MTDEELAEIERLSEQLFALHVELWEEDRPPNVDEMQLIANAAARLRRMAAELRRMREEQPVAYRWRYRFPPEPWGQWYHDEHRPVIGPGDGEEWEVEALYTHPSREEP